VDARLIKLATFSFWDHLLQQAMRSIFGIRELVDAKEKVEIVNTMKHDMYQVYEYRRAAREAVARPGFRQRITIAANKVLSNTQIPTQSTDAAAALDWKLRRRSVKRLSFELEGPEGIAAAAAAGTLFPPGSASKRRKTTPNKKPVVAGETSDTTTSTSA
jgi:hypothetical protein